MSKKRISQHGNHNKQRVVNNKLVRTLIQKLKLLVQSWNLVKLLILLEVLINWFIINNIKYTEIDWSTYMAQVDQIFNSSNLNFNYTQIEGPTGPLVYPAGHVYIFYLFKGLTEGGNIQLAQYIYLCIYIAQLFFVYKIYSHRRVLQVPPYMFLIMCFTSYRIHSIYVLRLFNDPIAVLLAYASFYCILRKKHTLSAFLFSLAISVKMNILLYAPAYMLVFYQEVGLVKSIKDAGVSAATQLILAAPFLYSDPAAYVKRAFDFGRVFLHQWTVNWRFLDETTFTSPQFFKVLLAVHVCLILMMFWLRWRRDDAILTLFITNFIGIACSRSLHYQFYVWYYHSLPMILWATRYSVACKLLILGVIEYAWNQYPSTAFSSSLLHAGHIAILAGLFARCLKKKKIVNTQQANGNRRHIENRS